MIFLNPGFIVHEKCALIVGASSGVGFELASQLYKKNCSVILIARSNSNLLERKNQLKRFFNESLTATIDTICLDISNYKNAVDLWNKVNILKKEPDFIFCCAGSSIPKLFKDLSENEITQGISLNYNTTVFVIHAYIQNLIKQSNGELKKFVNKKHIILFSSTVSFFPFIGYSQYAPIKAAIQSLSTILRHELVNYNIRISCIFPGNFQSSGFEEEQKVKPIITRMIEGPSKPISSEKCADIIIKNLENGYDTITTDFIGWLLSCGSMISIPKKFFFLQIIGSFILLILSPLINFFIIKKIKRFFDESENKKNR